MNTAATGRIGRAEALDLLLNGDLLALGRSADDIRRRLHPDGIVMSAVLPGVVFTEQGHWAGVLKERPEHATKYLEDRTVLKRFGRPDEISPMVVMLC